MAILVVSMIEGLKNDFGQIIGDEIFVYSHKCLITNFVGNKMCL